MKALVLAGGLPQIELIKKLKKRGIVTILADYKEDPLARTYADEFYRISTLDVRAVRDLAKTKKVDFLITVCTDQALLTVAQVSEELGLPCYLDYETARKATNKVYMKDTFLKQGIPTAKYVIMEQLDVNVVSGWDYPMIVKPVDCNSSKGVKKVANDTELAAAFEEAWQLSRSRGVVVEEFLEGRELSIDAYVEDGKAIILDITASEKTDEKDKFIIFRTWHIVEMAPKLRDQISEVTQRIADAFSVKNAPMLIQMLTDGNNVNIIEFSVRTGGGVKHLSVQRMTGVDVIEAVIDLTLGINPHIQTRKPRWKYMLDEYIYCDPGLYDHAEGFDELMEDGSILDYYIFQRRGSKLENVTNSGDRVAGFTVVADSRAELTQKYLKISASVRMVSESGNDIMRHERLGDLYEKNMFEIGGAYIHAG